MVTHIIALCHECRCLLSSSKDIRNRYVDAGHSRLSNKLVAAVYGYNEKDTQDILENIRDNEAFFLLRRVNDSIPVLQATRSSMKL